MCHMKYRAFTFTHINLKLSTLHIGDNNFNGAVDVVGQDVEDESGGEDRDGRRRQQWIAMGATLEETASCD